LAKASKASKASTASKASKAPKAAKVPKASNFQKSLKAAQPVKSDKARRRKKMLMARKAAKKAAKAARNADKAARKAAEEAERMEVERLEAGRKEEKERLVRGASPGSHGCLASPTGMMPDDFARWELWDMLEGPGFADPFGLPRTDLFGMPGTWPCQSGIPEWNFPPMTPFLEDARKDAERLSGTGDCVAAAMAWKRLHAFAAGIYGANDPRAWASLSRAAERCMLSGTYGQFHGIHSAQAVTGLETSLLETCGGSGTVWDGWTGREEETSFAADVMAHAWFGNEPNWLDDTLDGLPVTVPGTGTSGGWPGRRRSGRHATSGRPAPPGKAGTPARPGAKGRRGKRSGPGVPQRFIRKFSSILEEAGSMLGYGNVPHAAGLYRFAYRNLSERLGLRAVMTLSAASGLADALAAAGCPAPPDMPWAELLQATHVGRWPKISEGYCARSSLARAAASAGLRDAALPVLARAAERLAGLEDEDPHRPSRRELAAMERWADVLAGPETPGAGELEGPPPEDDALLAVRLCRDMLQALDARAAYCRKKTSSRRAGLSVGEESDPPPCLPCDPVWLEPWEYPWLDPSPDSQVPSPAREMPDRLAVSAGRIMARALSALGDSAGSAEALEATLGLFPGESVPLSWSTGQLMTDLARSLAGSPGRGARERARGHLDEAESCFSHEFGTEIGLFAETVIRILFQELEAADVAEDGFGHGRFGEAAVRLSYADLLEDRRLGDLAAAGLRAGAARIMACRDPEAAAILLERAAGTLASVRGAFHPSVTALHDEARMSRMSRPLRGRDREVWASNT
jgi:hypothetical protein